MKKPILVIAAILAVLVGVRVVMGLAPQDDKKLVREALAESIKASREGRPGGVMDKISDKLTVNGDQRVSNPQIADWIRNSKPDIVVQKQDPVIIGEEAQITSPVRVKLQLPIGNGTAFDQTISDVTLVFAKESATDWLIIPTTKWRLREVKLPEDVATQLGSGFGGFGGMGSFGF
jgi:hypothetical protein